MEIHISEAGIERLCGDRLCAGIEFIDRHIGKHGLDCNREGYVQIGERISNGEQGIHSGSINDIPHVVVVDGTIEKDGTNLGILRSVRRCGLTEFNELIKYPPTCEEHGNIPYAHGFCPFC